MTMKILDDLKQQTGCPLADNNYLNANGNKSICRPTLPMLTLSHSVARLHSVAPLGSLQKRLTRRESPTDSQVSETHSIRESKDDTVQTFSSICHSDAVRSSNSDDDNLSTKSLSMCHLEPEVTETIVPKERKYVDVHGVRISPACVVFHNTFEGQTYVTSICIRNISSKCVLLRTSGARSGSFKLDPVSRCTLAPGLGIQRKICYHCTKSCVSESSLTVFIDEFSFELPLIASKEQAVIEVKPTVMNFGHVDLGSKGVEQCLTVRNGSSCATKFSVDVGPNDLDLVVTPNKGRIRPHNRVGVKVYMTPMVPGEFVVELWITTDMGSTRIEVNINVCKRSLITLHPNTIGEFTLIDFKPTFCGSERYETVVVYNMASTGSLFVALAEISNEKLVPIEEARETHPNFRMFSITPNGGRINPYEGRIFTISFAPISESRRKLGWKHADHMDSYLCAIKIMRLEADDYNARPNTKIVGSYQNKVGKSEGRFTFIPTLRPSNDENMPQPPIKDALLDNTVSVRLCVHGESEVPKLMMNPETLCFNEMQVNSSGSQTIRLTNCSTSLPLAFKYVKVSGVSLEPKFAHMKPSMSLDVKVTVVIRTSADKVMKVKLEILTYANLTDKTTLKTVDCVKFLIITKDSSHLVVVPKPRINPGISPLITHEVGFLVDDVTFASDVKKPRNAMVGAEKNVKSLPWIKSKAIVAFPNDMPKTLRHRETTQYAKTIFKGLPRYIPPIDNKMTYSVEDRAMKKRLQYLWFREIFRGTAAQIKAVGTSVSSEDYDISCLKHYQMLDLKPVTQLPPIEDNKNRIPKDILIHLTVLQLYNIKIFPEVICFGNVTTYKDCYQNLTVENRNPFPVCARLIAGRTGLRISTLKLRTIAPMSSLNLKLVLNRENMGHFSGSINCVINEYHSFDIGVTADVVSKSLRLSADGVEFKMVEHPFHPHFLTVEVQSFLNTAVSFSWLIPVESPYQMEPLNGIVEERGVIACAVYFDPVSLHYKTSPIRLQVEGVKCQQLKCHTVFTKPSVYFKDTPFDAGVLPFGLPTLRRAIMFNASYNDVMFVVLSKYPATGVKIYPSSGTIKARGSFTLHLNFNVFKVGSLNFLVYVTIQTSATIEMKVFGEVVSPFVEIKPNNVSLLHVPCNSWLRTVLTVSNKSKAEVNLQFNLDLYPQFKVSPSKRLCDPGFTEKGFKLEANVSQKIFLHFIPKNMASYDFILPIVVNNDNDIKGENSSCDTKSIDNSMGKESSQDRERRSVKTKGHRVTIDCVVNKPLLSFPDSVFYFTKHGESKILTISNEENKEVVCMINTEELYSNFTISYNTLDKMPTLNGKLIIFTLGPGEKAQFEITFCPVTSGRFNTDLPVYLNDTIYLFIQLSGEKLPVCSLSCDKEQIHLAPVPLGVDFKSAFYLKAHNHTNKSFTVLAKVEKAHTEVLKVQCLQSSTVPAGEDVSLLPVSLSFCSYNPLSIKAKVYFELVGESVSFSIYVYAAADNSILTTYGFVYAHLSPHRILKDYDANLDPGDELSDKISISNESINTSKVSKVVALHRESPRNSFDSVETISVKQRLSTPLCTKGVRKESPPVELQKQQSIAKDARMSNCTSTKVDAEKEETKKSKSSKQSSCNEEEDGDIESMYPKFPRESNTEYSKYMTRVRNSVELWLYEQVFSCSFAPRLGCETFSGFLQIRKESSSSSAVVLKHIVNVYDRLFGKEVIKFLPPIDKLPDEGIERVLYIYTIYSKILEFVTVQGGLLSQVEPQLLMPYTDYVLFMNNTGKPGKEMIYECQNSDLPSNCLTESTFQQISLQCWLDLMLQTYKVTTLAMCWKAPLGHQTGPIFARPHEDLKGMERKTLSCKTFYSRQEDILLAWLNKHYNTQRLIIWKRERSFTPLQRSIVNFDQDLEDGLVLTAVTAYHCPFLCDLFFQDMFLQPDTICQAYHNTVRLITAWNNIQLGFSITPKDFVRPNPVTMLMLVAHLYHILPSYKPEATVTFSASLNTTETQLISLENPSDYTVSYITKIIGDENNSFSLTEEGFSFKLGRKQTKTITVCYTGRKATKVKATLLVCGTCYPPMFGRNFVFTLEGNPVKLPDSAVFNIKSPLNTPTRTTLWIISPHQAQQRSSTEQVYDIWYTEQEPRSGELNILKWAEEKLRKIPRRLFILTDQLKIGSGEKVPTGPIDIQVTCFSPALRSFWLVFMNKDVGDFIVKVTSTSYPPAPMMCLKGNIKAESECTCQNTQQSNTIISCERSCIVDVPCRNQNIWSSVKFLMELSSLPSEKEFWASHLEKNIGLRLVQWMLGDKEDALTEEIQHIFDKYKTFNLSCTSEYVSFNHRFTIPDLRVQGTTPLSLHIHNDCPLPLETKLVLTSQDIKEIRIYDLLIENSCDENYNSI